MPLNYLNLRGQGKLMWIQYWNVLQLSVIWPTDTGIQKDYLRFTTTRWFLNICVLVPVSVIVEQT